MNAAAPVLTQIRFHGHLRAEFGRGYPLDVKSPAEAIRALHYVLKGFSNYLQKHSEPGYRVIVGSLPIYDGDELHHPAIGKVIHIVPAVAGRGGLGKVLGGLALIALSFVPGLNVAIIAGFSTTFSSLAFSIGVSMALAGVSQALAGNPQAPTPQESPENLPSYAFNGAVNTTAQGNPVPILYGELEVGSQVISAGLEASELATTGALITPSTLQILQAKFA